MTAWAVTTASSLLEFDTDYGFYNSCYQIDSNHFINFWSGNGNDGFVQVFEINTSTWAVTTASSPLEFDTALGRYNSCYQIDSNHFINFWNGMSYTSGVQVFEISTSTWAVTTANDRLEFDTVSIFYNSCYQIDSNHFVNFWGGKDFDGYVQVFTVEISTGEIGTNIKINIGDTWKDVSEMKINIGDVWKAVSAVKINIGDTWKDVF